MDKKTVLYPIEVPEGKFCWPQGDNSCDHFDNEGGHSVCELDLGDLKDVAEGTLKAPKCAALKGQVISCC